jgi:hypothetical protein
MYVTSSGRQSIGLECITLLLARPAAEGASHAVAKFGELVGDAVGMGGFLADTL